MAKEKAKGLVAVTVERERPYTAGVKWNDRKGRKLTVGKIELWPNGQIVSSRYCSEVEPPPAEQGRKQKTYGLTWSIYRKISSAAFIQLEKRQGNVCFWTFTTQNLKCEEVGAKCFSDLLKNLKKNHGLNSYIWVKERQGNGNLHWHAILDMAYINVVLLSSIWSATLCRNRVAQTDHKNSVNISKNKSGKVVYLRDTKGAVKYLCKYMSKQLAKREKPYMKRCYGMSRNIQPKPKTLTLDEFHAVVGNEAVAKVLNFEYGQIICLDI